MRTARLWAAVCGVLVLTSPAMAQGTADTLPATVDWLERNLGGAACVVFQMGPSRDRLEQVTENTEVRFAGCRMTLQQATVRGSISEVRTFQVSLDRLSPDGVTSSPGFNLPEGWSTAGDVPSATIRLSAHAGERPIDASVEQFGLTAPTTYRTGAVDFFVLHPEMADRIVTALARAIALCRERLP